MSSKEKNYNQDYNDNQDNIKTKLAKVVPGVVQRKNDNQDNNDNQDYIKTKLAKVVPVVVPQRKTTTKTTMTSKTT